MEFQGTNKIFKNADKLIMRSQKILENCELDIFKNYIIISVVIERYGLLVTKKIWFIESLVYNRKRQTIRKNRTQSHRPV